MRVFMDSLRDYWSSLCSRSEIVLGDLYLQSSSGHHMTLDDGRLEDIGSSSSSGIGARLLRGKETLYASRNGTDGNALKKVMEEISILRDCEAGRAPEGGSLLAIPVLPFMAMGDELIRLDRKIRSLSSKVAQVSLAFSSSEKNVLVIREDGSVCRDKRRYSMYSVNIVAEKDGDLQTGSRVVAQMSDIDGLLRKHDLDEIASEALRTAETMLEATLCPAGSMDVVFAGEAGGTMIHEACGHGMEADIVEKDFSVYRGRIGETIASPSVTIVDDGSIPGLYGSFEIDDEGTPSRRNVLVDKGVLKAYMTDRETSERTGFPLTGNGRRSSYRVPPQTRMSNTFVEPGETTMNELLGSVDNGLLVRQMGGGEVNPTSGDFVFHVTEGYLVKGGKVTVPVRGAILTGNGPDVLRRVVGVGTDLRFLPGMCGKGGQSVPVTDGQPALLVENITVGGSSTD